MYKLSHLVTWQDSPIYHALIYRKDDTITKESVMDEFMEFITAESEYELSNDELNHIQSLINEFMVYDIDKVKAGEIEMLEKWTKAANGG